jgi:hypothetical protein
MMSKSTLRNDAFLADDNFSARWAAKAQVEIIALYRQIENRDPSDAAIIPWSQQLMSGLSVM